MKLKPYDSDIPPGSPSVEHRDMHPQDRQLRLCGFRIKQRPPNKPPIWERWEKGHWVEYTQAQAYAVYEAEYEKVVAEMAG